MENSKKIKIIYFCSFLLKFTGKMLAFSKGDPKPFIQQLK